MTTATINLDILGVILPDNSSSNAPCAVVIQKSSGAAPTPHIPKLLFDASTQEHCGWSFRLPGDYSSAASFTFQFMMASATSGKIAAGIYILAVTTGDATDIDAATVSTVNNSGGTTVGGTAGYMLDVTTALANFNSGAAGDYIFLVFARLPADANDTATGDMEVISASFTYTTT